MINSLSLSISFGSLIALCTLIWGIYVYLREERKGELADPESRESYHQAFNDLLTANRFDYASYLQSVLGKVDGFFGPHEFSEKSYDLCLKWAFIYPIMLGLLFWLGSNQDISGFGLFSPIEEGRLWRVPLMLFLLTFMMFTFYKFSKENKLKNLIWFFVFGTLTTAVSIIEEGAGPSMLAFIFIAILLSSGILFNIWKFIKNRNSFEIEFSFDIGFLFNSAAMNIFHILTFSILISFFVNTSSLEYGIIISVICLFFIVFVHFLYLIFKIKNLLFIFYALCFPLIAGFFSLFLMQPWILVNKQTFGALIFFVVLPIVNVLFDWTSLGLTRKLLRKSLKAPERVKKALYYSLDLAAALLILLFLIGSLIAAIKAMEWAAGVSALEQPTYDLGALWERIESRSVWQTLFSSDGWVFIMVFSTFLPSLIHGLAFGGFLLTITQPDRSKISRFAEATASGHQLALKEKNEIAAYLARQSIANVAFPVIGVLLLAGIILALLLSFGDILAGLIGG